MWIYEKRLEYPVRITKPDPRMAKLLMAQYGGPDSEVCTNKEIADHRVHLPNKNAGQYGKTGAFSDDPGISDRGISASMVRSQGDIRNPYHERDPVQSVRIPDSATDRTAGLFHWIQV